MAAAQPFGNTPRKQLQRGGANIPALGSTFSSSSMFRACRQHVGYKAKMLLGLCSGDGG